MQTPARTQSISQGDERKSKKFDQGSHACQKRRKFGDLLGNARGICDIKVRDMQNNKMIVVTWVEILVSEVVKAHCT